MKWSQECDRRPIPTCVPSQASIPSNARAESLTSFETSEMVFAQRETVIDVLECVGVSSKSLPRQTILQLNVSQSVR